MSLSSIERFFLYGKKGDYLEVTKNYALNRPAQDDFYDVDDFNENMDIIDEELYALENPVYEDAKTLETLKSGEKIVTAFGKIAKAITDFIRHISDEVVHITADERMKWNAKQDASTAINTGNIGNQSVKYATSAGRADYAHLSDYLKVINTDWNGFFDDNAYARVRYDGKYIRFDADMGGKGVGSACSYADSATYASKMKVIKQDWSGELDGAYGILYYNGTHLQLMGSDGTKTVYAKCNYADSAGTAVDQTARDSAANANNNANGRLSTSGGTISGNLSVGGNLTMGRDIYMGNHSIFSLGILQGTSTLHLRTPDKVTVENEAGNANMNLLCSYLHCVGVVNTSYREAKENIIQVSEETARKILDVPIFKFDYRPGFGDGKKNVVGTIVDEVQSIIPESVVIPEDWNEGEFNELLGDIGNGSIPSVDYTTFIPYLIAMVQLQQKEIDELKQKVTALENK